MTRLPTRPGRIAATTTPGGTIDRVTHTATVLRVTEGGSGATALDSADLSMVDAVSAADALKRLDDRRVDCVVSDVSLPDMDLVGFLDAVGAAAPDVPVFLVGEPDRPGRIDEALAAGAEGHYEAVGDPLRDRILATVAERRTERELERHRRLKDAVREVAASLVDATTRDEVEATLHHALSASDRYRFVWVGEYDDAAGKVRLRRPTATALDADELASLLGSDDAGFIERAATTGSVEAATGSADFRSAAAAGTAAPIEDTVVPDGSLLCVALPLSYDDAVRGMAIVADEGRSRLDEAERDVLGQLGRIAGHALATVEGGAAGGGAPDAERQFAERLAHELRNPLGVASTHLDIGRESDDEESFERVETALSEMERTIDGLLEMAADDGVDATSVRDLSADVEEAWATVPHDGADLTVEDDAPIEADHDLVVRLLSNLFRNAVEHGSTATQASLDDGLEGGATAEDRDDGVAVRVGVRGDGGFYVEDDGPGIPDERTEEVFEWGYSTADGTGIGLTLVREIADAHGWDVTVLTGEDGGARFEISGVEMPSDGNSRPSAG